MTLSDEIAKLHELHRSGALTDEEFARAKERLIGGAHRPELASGVAALNALRRSTSDRWIAGVCGGLAQATGADTWIWRLVYAALLLFGGAGLLIYALFWIFVPSE
ncbi:MAG: PspC domain-containing protein [Burkholderiaceae bacterium]|nr:PspC domain-containing protein [Burkholderiaceae bacterium]